MAAGFARAAKRQRLFRLYDDATETEEDDSIRLRLDAEARAALCHANGVGRWWLAR